MTEHGEASHVDVDASERASPGTGNEMSGVASYRPRWVPYTVCGSAFLTLFAIWGNFYIFSLLLNPLLCEFKAGRGATAGVTSVGLLLLAFFAPVSTYIVKHYRTSVSLFGGVIFCCLGNVLASFSPNLTVLYLTYGVVLGVGSSLSYTAVLVDLPLYYPFHQRSRAIAFAETGAVLGLIAMAPLMDVCIREVGWRHALWVFGALMAALLLPAPFAFNPKYRYRDDGGGSSGRSDVTVQLHATERVDQVSISSSEDSMETVDALLLGPQAPSADKSMSNGGIMHAANHPLNGVANHLDSRSLINPSSSLHTINLSADNASIGVGVDTESVPATDTDTIRTVVTANGDHQPASSTVAPPPRDRLSFLRPYILLCKDYKFNVFLTASCIWYFCFTAPLTFLIDMVKDIHESDHGNTTTGNLSNATVPTSASTCVASFSDSILYIYMALAMLVCFPLGGILFDRAPRLPTRLLILSAMYLVTAGLIAVIPFATNQWQFALASVGLGVSRSPDILHPAFLMSIVSDDQYGYAYALLLMLSAVADGLAPPIVGVIRDSVQEYVTPYLFLAGVATLSAIILFLLYLRVTARSLTSVLTSVCCCCCKQHGCRRGWQRLDVRSADDVDDDDDDAL